MSLVEVTKPLTKTRKIIIDKIERALKFDTVKLKFKVQKKT